MLQYDRHLTTEQLSAFLDQQFSTQEQTRYQLHLDGCQDCREKLADLRQTVALLRALPPAKLPRSFVLPVDHAQDQETSEKNQRAHHPRPIRPTPFQIAARTASALAAVIGIFFLLSTLLTMLTIAGQATSMANYATSQHTPSVDQSQPQTVASPNIASGTAETPEAATSTEQPPARQRTPQPADNATPFLTSLLIALSMPQVRASTGILFLLLGIVGIVLTRRSHTLHAKRKE